MSPIASSALFNSFILRGASGLVQKIGVIASKLARFSVFEVILGCFGRFWGANPALFLIFWRNVTPPRGRWGFGDHSSFVERYASPDSEPAAGEEYGEGACSVFRCSFMNPFPRITTNEKYTAQKSAGIATLIDVVHASDFPIQQSCAQSASISNAMP